ncbi:MULTISPECIES: hypothetical protein [unclassified Rhizobium]|uniref:hypothetical protein n=1 Tax=unclassified Rhizobium TaxID=2613769 RepID=UPI001FE10B7F|nr:MULTISPECIES: hypothetical protein [unclassified Rhizobium]
MSVAGNHDPAQFCPGRGFRGGVRAIGDLYLRRVDTFDMIANQAMIAALDRYLNTDEISQRHRQAKGLEDLEIHHIQGNKIIDPPIMSMFLGSKNALRGTQHIPHPHELGMTKFALDASEIQFQGFMHSE